MRDLIDDLLAFSQVSRENVVKEKVDMLALVNNVVKELREPGQESIYFEFRDLPSAICDSKLMRQVLYNLMSNALKYSQTRPKQEIQIGGKADERKVIYYYVKDNRVGLDMKHSERLFKVFERLHNRSEPESTGLGLAIVQQIISKHGGEVWADGKINAGATFYFTLPVS